MVLQKRDIIRNLLDLLAYNALLLESGSFLLKEDGGAILLES